MRSILILSRYINLLLKCGRSDELFDACITPAVWIKITNYYIK